MASHPSKPEGTFDSIPAKGTFFKVKGISHDKKIHKCFFFSQYTSIINDEIIFSQKINSYKLIEKFMDVLF